jgi:hypothetical protein
MLDRATVVVGQAGGDRGAVAGLGVTLDAQERGDAVGRQGRGERGEVGTVEDFGGVAADVLGRERDATLADADTGVLGVPEAGAASVVGASSG